MIYLESQRIISYTPQYFHIPYLGCLQEIEIQIFKKYGYLNGRKNRLDTKNCDCY